MRCVPETETETEAETEAETETSAEAETETAAEAEAEMRILAMFISTTSCIYYDAADLMSGSNTRL